MQRQLGHKLLQHLNLFAMYATEQNPRAADPTRLVGPHKSKPTPRANLRKIERGDCGFSVFQVYGLIVVMVGRFRIHHEPAATANMASRIMVPKGKVSGMALFTLSVATARAPPVSMAVTL